MNREEALASLGLAPGASDPECHAAYRNMLQRLEDRLAAAPTDGLRQKYRDAIDRLDTAFSIVSRHDGADVELPLVKPHFTEDSASEEPIPADQGYPIDQASFEPDEGPRSWRDTLVNWTARLRGLDSRQLTAIGVVSAVALVTLVFVMTDSGSVNREKAVADDGIGRSGPAVMAGTAFTIPGTDFSMVWIDPGQFEMGSPLIEPGRDSDERQHTVTIPDGFWIGKYEVTQTQWWSVMGDNPSCFNAASHPVERVSWDDCMLFCSKFNRLEKAAGRLPEGYAYSLPTEAQWEFACRAGTTSAYSHGNRIDAGNARLGYRNNPSGREGTVPVGSYPPNDHGLYDMHGNVWEWCLDAYSSQPSRARPDSAATGKSRFKVSRGGGWLHGPEFSRSASRTRFPSDSRGANQGFRLALVKVTPDS